MAKMKMVRNEIVEPDLNVLQKTEDFTEIAKLFLGQKVAVIAARYQYRGVLSHVNSNSMVLANACAVESSGESKQEKPSNEDQIGSSVVIKLDAIELFYQPTWVFFTLPGEK